MIINQTPVQYSVSEQKRPQFWVSVLPPREIITDVGNINLFVGGVKLVQKVFDANQMEDSSLSLVIKDQKLIEAIKVDTELEEASLRLFTTNHRLREVIHSYNPPNEASSITLSVGDQKLYLWGVSAEMLDEDNLDFSFNIGNQRLYEEQS